MDGISQRAQFQFFEVNRLATKTEGIAASFRLALRRRPRLVATRLVADHGSARRAGVFHPNGAPQQALQAGDQNGQLKGLWQVIVRARREPLEHIFRTPAGGQHQNRHIIFLLAQQGRDIKAALAREHDVENDRVEAFFFFEQPVQSRLAVGRNFHSVSFGLQVEAQALRQVRLVLHHQHAAHGSVTFRGNSFLGNSRITVVPFPAPSLCAKTRPPCLRAIERTMNNPSPVPFTPESERCVTR